MIEHMVEYGRRGIVHSKLRGLSSLDNISRLEIYKVSILTSVELKQLMFHLGIEMGSVNNQPVNSMSEDEMRMEYLAFRKREIEENDEKIDEVKETHFILRSRIRRIMNGIIEVIKYN